MKLRRSWLTVAAGVSVLSIVLAGCSSSGGGGGNATSGSGGASSASAGGSGSAGGAAVKPAGSCKSDAKVDTAISGYKGPCVDLSGVSITATSSEPDALTMGILFAYGKLTQWGAHFDHVVITTTSGIQTMIAGKSNLAAQGADEVVLGNSQGANVVGVGSPDSKQHYVLVAKNSISNIKDLRGKSIAMSGPSGFDTLLSKYALHTKGMSPSDARFVQIGGSPDRVAALIAGSVDAATIFLAGWDQLHSKTNKYHVLDNFAKTTSFPGDLYYAKASFLKSNPQVGLALACANLEANDWLTHNQNAYVQFTLRNVKGADAAATKQTWKDAISAGQWPSQPKQILPSSLDSLQEAMLISGEIDKKADLSNAVDQSYLEKAAAMGCGTKH